MKSQLISSMSSFLLGTGATLVALSTWLGTSDLESIKSLVENHMSDTEQQVSLFVQDYQVQVDSANAEIGEYKDALAQANDNISQLITAYENAEFEHEMDLKGQQSQYEQDLADLQQAYDEMVARIESDYESTLNYYIEQANAEIDAANQEVAETKRYIEEDLLPTSQIDEYIRNAQEYDKVDTTGDKTVTDISSIVPSNEQ